MMMKMMVMHKEIKRSIINGSITNLKNYSPCLHINIINNSNANILNCIQSSQTAKQAETVLNREITGPPSNHASSD
jgi:hypothetical protein